MKFQNGTDYAFFHLGGDLNGLDFFEFISICFYSNPVFIP